jgi:hypothetical protein
LAVGAVFVVAVPSGILGAARKFRRRIDHFILQDSELRLLVRDRLRLRIEPEMCKYLLRRAADSDRPLAVIGGDARTGVPRREVLDPRLLCQEPS